MFWKKRSFPQSKTKGVPPHVLRALEAADQPDSWETLDEGALGLVAFLKFTRYGNSPAIADQPVIRRLYSVLLKRMSEERRLHLEQSICQYAIEGETGVLAILPFLLGETALSVLSTASLDYAMLMPREKGDPLSGPNFLMNRYEQSKGNDTLRLGILTGVILLGDERLLPLVLGRWRDLDSSEDRRRLAAAFSGYVSTLQVEFLMDWLENTSEESDVGAIAGAMVGMPRSAHAKFVVRLQRYFPATEAKPGQEIKPLEQWTFAEYAEKLRPRLRPLIANEEPPKVIETILDTWTATD